MKSRLTSHSILQNFGLYTSTKLHKLNSTCEKVIRINSSATTNRQLFTDSGNVNLLTPSLVKSPILAAQSLSRSLCNLKGMAGIEQGKRVAAWKAVDDLVKTGMNIGVGSGSTVVYAVERIAERVRTEGLVLTCVPTSFQAQQLIVEHNLPLRDLQQFTKLDLAIDGADEVDSNLDMIKGGGACLTQEKIVASCAKVFAGIADYRKDSKCLGETWKKGVPIEVIPFAYRTVQVKIMEKFGGNAVLRQAKMKAGPVVTDNGNFIVDWMFDRQHDWDAINNFITMIPGVVETGLFVNMASVVYFGQEDGTCVRRNK